MNALGIADLATSIPGVGKFLGRLNPFSRPAVTQGAGGKRPGPRMPGGGPRVTTSGGAPAPKPPGQGGWWKKLLPFADDAAKGGAKLGAKGAGMTLGRLIPGAQTALGLGLAGHALSEGDIVGAALSAGSAIPIAGWGFLAADLIRQGVGKDVFDKSFGNAIGGNAGFTDEQIEEREKTMSATERALTTMTIPFSEGGILPMNKGGLVDNPTKTTLNPGDAVLPLNSTMGKNLFGDTQSTESLEDVQAIPFKTIGATLLGISSRMLKATDSGIAGDLVRQDITSLSRTFGVANLTTTSSLGRAQFTKQNTEKKSEDFLMKVFKGMKLFGLGGGPGKEKPEKKPTDRLTK
jgi:hypothetical protein